jgi:hypothetical protein
LPRSLRFGAAKDAAPSGTDLNVGHYEGKPIAKERKYRTLTNQRVRQPQQPHPEGVSYRTMLHERQRYIEDGRASPFDRKSAPFILKKASVWRRDRKLRQGWGTPKVVRFAALTQMH